MPARDLETRLAHSLDPEGQVLDGASRGVARARRAVREARHRLVQRLETILGALDPTERAPDAAVTVRGGRYVIPVRGTARSKVGGIVHDESATRSTVFVEPPEVIELGNALRASDLLSGSPVVPLAIGGQQVAADRPGAKRITAEQMNQPGARHADVACPRRHGARRLPRTAVQQLRIVAPYAIDDLGNLIERDGPGAAEVKEAAGVAGQEKLKDAVQVVGVGAGADLIEVESCGPVVAEARLNPVDGAGMAIEARSHRQ